MASWKRITLAIAVFYVLTAGLLWTATLAHEYSHYVAHEGWDPAPVRFYDTPQDAHEDLVFVETMQLDGRTYRVENVRETTIVLYDDALLYAATLNLLPVGAYETGSLGATFLHADQADLPRLLDHGHDDHWGTVMGAPLVLATVMVTCIAGLTAWRPWLVHRSLLVTYAAEVGNNTHHAADVGLSAAAFGVVAQLIFAAALMAAVAMSPTYRSLLRQLAGRPAGRSIDPPAMPRSTPTGAALSPAFHPAPRADRVGAPMAPRASAPRPGLRFRHAGSARPTGPTGPGREFDVQNMR